MKIDYMNMRKTWEDYRYATHTNTRESCINYLDRTFLELGVLAINYLDQQANNLAVKFFDERIAV